MRTAVLSDSYNNIPNFRRAVLRTNQEEAKLLIRCGDLISPFMLQPYLAQFKGSVHLIYVNNGGDLISSRCVSPDTEIRGVHGTLIAGALRRAIEHHPNWARNLARSGDFDLVCCFHNHIFHVKRLNECVGASLRSPGQGKRHRPIPPQH